MEVVLETKNLCKSFGAVMVNDKINLTLHRGEIMAVLGENGSGKTTLINMIGGIYYPDSGSIYYENKRVEIRSPKDADRLGIGVVHQHFKLVSSMDAVENIEIALSDKEYKNKADIRKRITDVAKKYGFTVNPDKKICDMSVSEKQTVEIIKAIIKGAKILILDEPTAVLTPQESSSLFNVIRSMKKDGKSIIIITHKLQEVLDISDNVYIMRKGRYIDTLKTSETDENELACKMVGKTVTLQIARTSYEKKKTVLSVHNISCLSDDKTVGLSDVSFDLKSGEILGIAGISGSGQKELCECIDGIREVTSGKIKYYAEEGNFDITNKKPEWRRKNKTGFGFVPEDRLGMGLVGGMGMTGNMMLRSWKKGKGVFVNRKDPNELAMNIWKELEVVTPSTSFPVRRMSGGNVQKVLVGREIAQEPAVLMTAYAVRGLDINTSYTIYNLLTEQKMKGVAVVYVGEDLDVLLELCDRIVVLCGGQVSGVVDGRTTNKMEVGALMTRMGGGKADE